jgi:hypothetical protein
VPWNDLLLTLTHAVGISNIKLRHPVQQIVHFSPVTTHRPIAMRTESEPKYQVTSRAGAGKWITRKVIVATTVESIRKLLPLPSQQAKIYKTVQGQPFLRIYGKFDKQSTAIMQEHVAKHTLVAGNIHRIIPMNIDKGVYMIVYSDNEGATRLKRYTENTDENRRVLCHLLERAVGIPRDTLKLIAIKSYFWEIGTHYYEPLPLPIPTPTLTHAPAASASASVSVSEIEKAHTEFVKKLQHPMPNVWVVGEAVSRNQGWVEGALESVEKVCKEWMTASLHLSK